MHRTIQIRHVETQPFFASRFIERKSMGLGTASVTTTQILDELS